MKPLKMQPTFTVDLPIDANEAVARLRQATQQPELCDHVLAAGTCFDFAVPFKEQRFWSPHLSCQISEVPSGSQIFGRFSPRPEIWTMFMAIYGVVLILMFAAAIFAYVQWFLNVTPWSIATLPIGALLIAGLHVASLAGQSLSSDQMVVLRSRLDRAIEVAFPEHLVNS